MRFTDGADAAELFGEDFRGIPGFSVRTLKRSMEEILAGRREPTDEFQANLLNGGIIVTNRSAVERQRGSFDRVLDHEKRHAWNQLISNNSMDRWDSPLGRIKDEIVAGLADG